MEQLNVFLKVVYGVILTFVLNKIISLFRTPQLYLAFYDVFRSVDKGIVGCSATITISNKGKDKEKAVEIVFPDAHLCKLVSCDYVAVSSTGNVINIDRVLAGQVVNFVVLVDGVSDLKKHKPVLRSETANGKTYEGRGRAPISAGPVVFSLSVIIMFMSFFVYIIKTEQEPSYPYLAMRYWSFYMDGFHSHRRSDNYIVSGTPWFESNYPLSYAGVIGGSEKLGLAFTLVNNTSSDIELVYGFEVANQREYIDEYLKANKVKDLDSRRKAKEEVQLRYNVMPYSLLGEKKVVVAPGKHLRFEVLRPLDHRVSMKDLSVRIAVEGFQDGTDKAFSDEYIFDPAANDNAKNKLLDLLNGVSSES